MKSKIFLTVLAGALTFIGCNDDFLETEPTQFISSGNMEGNPSLQEANIKGLYATMCNASLGESDDFGQKGFDIYSDMLSGDMVLGAYFYYVYSEIASLQATVDFTNYNNDKPWKYYYKIIYGANRIIGALGGNDAIPTSDKGKHYMGQSKAMRAYAYFYLANLFSEGYEASTPILPVYTDVNATNAALSPASEVYDLIIKDLKDAISLLSTFSRTYKNEINQDVAKGLLAYAYAAIGNNAEVKTLTKEIIDSGNFSIATAEEALGGFNNVSQPGWMWGVDIILDNNLKDASWWGQVDIYTDGLASRKDVKSIDDNLFDAIPDNDIRKQQFVDFFENGQKLPINKFYDSKKVLAGQANIESDYVYMRIAEMYLLNAEASAKTGDEANARAMLKVLMDKRVDDSSYLDGLSGQALLDEIYLQTRIEFWGEGKSYLAMKRNKATITRGPNHLFHAGKSFPYNADELTFEIPLSSEIQNNPNID